jgi:hypothetical protein
VPTPFPVVVTGASVAARDGKEKAEFRMASVPGRMAVTNR